MTSLVIMPLQTQNLVQHRTSSKTYLINECRCWTSTQTQIRTQMLLPEEIL